MQQIETIQKLIKQNQLSSSNSKSLDVFAHSSHPSKLHKSICSVAQFVSGLSEPGVPGEPWYPQFLADQLTLSQPRGVDYAHHITTCPPRFSDLPTALCPPSLSLVSHKCPSLYTGCPCCGNGDLMDSPKQSLGTTLLTVSYRLKIFFCSKRR